MTTQAHRSSGHDGLFARLDAQCCHGDHGVVSIASWISYKSSWPGLETPAAFDVVGLGKTLAGRNEHSKVAFGTEAGLFAASGIPTVVIGPGSIDQAHKADEYIAVAQIEACSAFLDQLAAHSCA